MLLVDTNVLLDVVTDDPAWADWAQHQLEAAALHHRLAINAVIYAEQPRRNEYGEWQCKVVHRLAGARDAGAVTVIASEGKLIIRTVEWEDRR